MNAEVNYRPLTLRPEKLHFDTNEKCNCMSPSIVLSPIVKDLIAQHGNYTYRGKFVEVKGKRLYNHFKVLFSPGSKVDISYLDNCYITDLVTGEIYPMYFLAPCGHCSICKSQKIEAFANRCLMESQCYPRAPWVVHLTYDPQHLPDDGVCVKDLQDFFKRLRSRLDYYGIDYKFRYFAAAEYGSNTHRAHYHILFWGLPDYKFWKMRQLMLMTWQKGRVFLSQVNGSYIPKGCKHAISKPEKAFEYVAKYLCKDCVVPFGMNQCFTLSSRGNGGIGAPFLDRHKDYIRRHRAYRFEFVDKFSQVKRKVVFSRYVVNRLFPSCSISVPSMLRKAILYTTRFAHVVKHGPELMEFARRVYRPHMLWREVFPFDWRNFIHTRGPSWVKCRHCPMMVHAFWYFSRFLVKYKDLDFSLVKDLDERRTYVLSKLSEHKQIRYFAPQNAEFVRNRFVARKRELL